jgi:hypothetical protein
MLPTVQKKIKKIKRKKKSKRDFKRSFFTSKRKIKKSFTKLILFYKKNKYISLGILFSVFLLVTGLSILLFTSRVEPNDDILFLKSSSKAVLENKNPTFNVSFGQKDNPEKQWTRFEARAVKENPFEQEQKGNIFTRVVDFVSPKRTLGIELSLESVGGRDVSTSTELVEVREVKKEEDTYIPFDKQAVLNPNVVDGVDVEYQILEGMGLKRRYSY